MTLTERKNAREKESEPLAHGRPFGRGTSSRNTRISTPTNSRARRTRDRLASPTDEARFDDDAAARRSLGVPCDRAASRSSRSIRRTADDAAPACLISCLLLAGLFAWLYSAVSHLSRCDGLTGILDEIRETKPDEPRRNGTR